MRRELNEIRILQRHLSEKYGDWRSARGGIASFEDSLSISRTPPIKLIRTISLK